MLKDIITPVLQLILKEDHLSLYDVNFRLKQKHPQIFTDLCLYSEVCLLLSEYSFRLFSRRFLQELFMDIDYSELYVEPYRILGISDRAENTLPETTAEETSKTNDDISKD